jgi:hypothetical protein
MPEKQAVLNPSDAQRLQTVLDCIAEVTSSRWAALDQLRYFCEGADTALLEAIGGKRFSTQAVLLQLLDTANELGGPIAVRSAPDHSAVPVGLVVQLLESLLCNATSNLKPFLKTTNGVKNLIGTLSHYEELMYDAQTGPETLDRACNILCYCTFYHPTNATKVFMAADGACARASPPDDPSFTRTAPAPSSLSRARLGPWCQLSLPTGETWGGGRAKILHSHRPPP